MREHKNLYLKLSCLLIMLFNIYVISFGYSKLDDILYKNSNNFEYNYKLVVYEKPKVEEKKVNEEQNKQNDIFVSKDYQVIDTLIGSMTGYGPDCLGCGGVTSSGHDLRNGNIYYEDSTYGTLRILAADRSIKIGTVIKVSGLKIYDKPFLAIVLDRGGAIKGTLMDLAFSTEEDPLVDQIGYSKNITYEVLRYGW